MSFYGFSGSENAEKCGTGAPFHDVAISIGDKQAIAKPDLELKPV